jgi:hypothetical protein
LQGIIFLFSKLFMHSFITSSLRSLTVASVLLLGACSKKDDPTTTPTTTYATTWTADSKNYTATTSTAAVNNNTMALVLGQAVSATEGYTMLLTVPAAMGSYDLAATSSLSSYTTNVGGTATAHIVTTGNVTVTTLSATEAIGTFNFTAVSINPIGTKIITNGKFAIKR